MSTTAYGIRLFSTGKRHRKLAIDYHRHAHRRKREAKSEDKKKKMNREKRSVPYSYIVRVTFKQRRWFLYVNVCDDINFAKYQTEIVSRVCFIQ